jgi:integrase/recombinase XerD
VPGKQAKILSEDGLEDLLVYASATRHPLRNRVLVLLSAKAGLRAGEIAQLTWDMVLGPTGEVGMAIELRDHAAKKRSGRRIPLHPDLRTALIEWRTSVGMTGPIVRSERGGSMTPLSVGGLVRPSVPGDRPRRLFVPFGSANVRHPSSQARP